jgi:hypothetical protein
MLHSAVCSLAIDAITRSVEVDHSSKVLRKQQQH